MVQPVRKDTLLLVLCSLFIVAWLYTEISERIEYRERWIAVYEFMAAKGPNASNRFTAEDGKKLESRIKALEAEIEEIESSK